MMIGGRSSDCKCALCMRDAVKSMNCEGHAQQSIRSRSKSSNRSNSSTKSYIISIYLLLLLFPSGWVFFLLLLLIIVVRLKRHLIFMACSTAYTYTYITCTAYYSCTWVLVRICKVMGNKRFIPLTFDVWSTSYAHIFVFVQTNTR